MKTLKLLVLLGFMVAAFTTQAAVGTPAMDVEQAPLVEKIKAAKEGKLSKAEKRSLKKQVKKDIKAAKKEMKRLKKLKKEGKINKEQVSDRTLIIIGVVALVLILLGATNILGVLLYVGLIVLVVALILYLLDRL